MPTRVTAASLKKLAADLLDLYPAVKRFERLKDQFKADMDRLGWDRAVVDGKGVVEIGRYDRTEIPVGLAVRELGEVTAGKIIQTKIFVSIELLDAFVKVGEISADQAQALKDAGTKTPVASLRITLEGGAQ
jgi:hypothetical protein